MTAAGSALSKGTRSFSDVSKTLSFSSSAIATDVEEDGDASSIAMDVEEDGDESSDDCVDTC